MGLLIKESVQHEQSRALLIKNLELISNVIAKVIETSDSWKNKKVKKTMQVVGLYTKAAKIIVHKGNAQGLNAVQQSGAQLIKAIEKECEKDKTMSNLKGRIKEIKALIAHS